MAPTHNVNNDGENKTRGRPKGRGSKKEVLRSASASSYTLHELRDKRKRAEDLATDKSAENVPPTYHTPAKKQATPTSGINPSPSEANQQRPESSNADGSPTETNPGIPQASLHPSSSSKAAKQGSFNSPDETNFQSPPPSPPGKIPPVNNPGTDALLHEMLGRFGKMEDKLEKLDSMEQQLSKLDVIEGKTNELSRDVRGFNDALDSVRTDLGTFKKNTEASNEEMKREISSLKAQLSAQDDKILSLSKDSEDKILAVTKSHFNQFTRHIEHAFVKEQAANRRLNLVFSGIQEGDHPSDIVKIRDIFKSRLKLGRVNIVVAYRLGIKRASSSKPRPLLVRFGSISDRSRVWKLKKKLHQNTEDDVWVQEDMPRALREDLRVLTKVAKYASTLKKDEYNSLHIKDFRIFLNGASYGPAELESLPYDLRPSSLCTIWSDESIIFFGRFSPLSNHHYSPFVSDESHYSCVEQFLAVAKAKLAEKSDILDRAVSCTSPSDCKGILNALKDDHPEEWEDCLPSILLEALRCKFNQNDKLNLYLRETYPRYIGEASTDPLWGIGFPLSDPQARNFEAWHPAGNLLGKTMTTVRGELIAKFGLV